MKWRPPALRIRHDNLKCDQRRTSAPGTCSCRATAALIASGFGFASWTELINCFLTLKWQVSENENGGHLGPPLLVGLESFTGSRRHLRIQRLESGIHRSA